MPEIDRASLKNLKKFSNKLKGIILSESGNSDVITETIIENTNENTANNISENTDQNTIENSADIMVQNTIEHTAENNEEHTLENNQYPCRVETNVELKQCNRRKRKRVNGSIYSDNGENNSIVQQINILDKEIEKRLNNSYSDSLDEIIDTSQDLSTKESSTDSSLTKDNRKRKRCNDPGSPCQEKRIKKNKMCIIDKRSRTSLRVYLKQLNLNRCSQNISGPLKITRESTLRFNSESIDFPVTIQKSRYI